jgi:Peptidase family S41/Tricorn protease C1 domain
MSKHDPERTFEVLWKTFNKRYPFFKLRNVDWNKQYKTYRPKVTSKTSDDELFNIICRMLAPLNDGHIELKAKLRGKKRYFNPERKPRFWQEFTKPDIRQLFKTTKNTLVHNGFGRPKESQAWMLHYCRSRTIGYIRILELDGVKGPDLKAALDTIAADFDRLDGFIIDIRNCPGGEDSIAITIINRFCDRKRIAFHRRTKIGPGERDYTRLKTWYLEPQGRAQFTRPIALLTCDSVFSGGEAFALAIRELPHVTIIGDHTNGIFSYQLEKKLPNGWEYCLSYQTYFSADMVCYEGNGVPVDIKLLKRKADIESGVDPLIVRAVELLCVGSEL